MKADQIRITEPCHENWDAMSREGKKRFCASCEKHVHDLNNMAEAEAEALVKGGGVCVRYTADTDGRVQHADTRQRRRLARGLAAGLGAALFSSTAFAAAAPAPSCSPSLLERVQKLVADWLQDENVEMMGDIAPEPLMGELEVVPEPEVVEPIAEITEVEPAPPPVMGRIARPVDLDPPEPAVELAID